MNNDQLDKHLERIETKVDRIDTKLDVLAGRTTRNETDVMWVKGGLAIGLSIILATAGYLITRLANLIQF
jgi:hypothetical protein